MWRRLAARGNCGESGGTWNARAGRGPTDIDGTDGVFVSNVVWCEPVWVLRSAYRHGAWEIAKAIGTIAAGNNARVDRPAVEAGLAMLRAGGDFADGVSQYEAERARCDRLFTLDAAFARRGDPAKVSLLRM